MSENSRPERATQDRVAKRFTNKTHPRYLGYQHLGDWKDETNNRNIEPEYLLKNLKKRGYSDAQISAALHKLEAAADTTGVSLYQANMRTYQFLRYGVQVQTTVEEVHDTVHLIDWDNPDQNDFALAEEVTLKGGYERRPDIVIYVNGIALGVMELKRHSVGIADAIEQLRTNQEEIFNKQFFSTVQVLFAGNDSEGLKFGTTGTPTKFFTEWKVQPPAKETDGQSNLVNETLGNYQSPVQPSSCVDAVPREEGYLLDEPLAEMCDKTRFLDLIRNFIIFDAGQKKVPRVHQYHGVKAAQERIKKKQGGVIWTLRVVARVSSWF